jgi:hypothetical protein
MAKKELTFNKDNWSGEDGTVTYDTDTPLAFEVEGYGGFWLEPRPWDTDADENKELTEILGEGFVLRGQDWAPDYSLGSVTRQRKNVEASAMGLCRDAHGVAVDTDEKLLVAAARIIFNTV